MYLPRVYYLPSLCLSSLWSQLWLVASTLVLGRHYLKYIHGVYFDVYIIERPYGRTVEAISLGVECGNLEVGYLWRFLRIIYYYSLYYICDNDLLYLFWYYYHKGTERKSICHMFTNFHIRIIPLILSQFWRKKIVMHIKSTPFFFFV